MVTRTHLTEAVVKKAAAKSDDYQVFDDEVLGLALVVYPSGSKAFALSYRWNGRQRRMVIGRWPEWSAVAARERARHLRREIDAGADPAKERADARAQPRMRDLAKVYVEEHLPRLSPRNASDQKSMLEKLVLPRLGTMLVSEVQPLDVERLLTEIAEGRSRPGKKDGRQSKPTPVRANRTGEVLRKMFAIAVKKKWRADNPASGFRRRVEVEREVFLGPEEVSRLAAALAATKDQRGAAILRMLLLTGARLGEVREARFEQFNLDLRIWSKPAATTKQRKTHRLPISSEVAAIVRQRREVVPEGVPWLFPGDVEGQPVKELRRFWAGIREDAKLPDIRIHDLRHTFASMLVSGGSSLEMIGKLLGHTQAKTTQRYAHLMDGPLRMGVDAVAGMVRVKPRLVEE